MRELGWLRAFLGAMTIAAAACAPASPTEEEATPAGGALGATRETAQLTLIREHGDYSNLNAFWMARLSSMAYDRDVDITWARLTNAGVRIGDAELLLFQNPSTDTQALLFVHETAIVVAFCGTESAKDWMTNASVGFTATRAGNVHSGFYSAFRSIWDEGKGTTVNGAPTATGLGVEVVRRAETLRRPVYVTGHSLGGALASLAAIELAKPRLLDPPIAAGQPETPLPPGLELEAVYTFGAPRIGDIHIAITAGFTTKSFFRVVNAYDFVTHLPRLPSYEHPVRRPDQNLIIYLSASGGWSAGEGVEFDADHWNGPSGGSAPIPDQIADHALGRYEEKLWKNRFSGGF